MSVAEGFASRRRYLWITAVVLVLDQASKILAHAYLSDRGPLTIVRGLFDLSYSRNPGGLFGYFSDLALPWRTLLLTGLPLVAVGLVTMLLIRGEGMDRKSLVALALILGGAVGNLIDRIVRGDVVDFLDVYISSSGAADWLIDKFGTAHWPTFNVADSAIVSGACLLMLGVLQGETADPAAETLPAARSDEPR